MVYVTMLMEVATMKISIKMCIGMREGSALRHLQRNLCSLFSYLIISSLKRRTDSCDRNSHFSRVILHKLNWYEGRLLTGSCSDPGFNVLLQDNGLQHSVEGFLVCDFAIRLFVL